MPPEHRAKGRTTSDAEKIFEVMFNTITCGGLKNDSSPGYPAMMINRRNDDLIDTLGAEQLAALATERVMLFNEISLLDMCGLTPMDLVNLCLVDPIRLFIKNEPHPKRKLDSGRVRIINSVSIVDSLVERYLSGPQNRLEISNYIETSAMPGMGNHPDEGGAPTTKAILETIIDKAGTDQEAYDWTNTHQMLMVDATIRARMAGEPDPLENTFCKRQLCLMTSVVVLDDGEIQTQKVRAIEKSGSYNTSSGNSRVRVVGRAIAFPELPLKINGVWQVRAMGDDAVENVPIPLRAEIASRYRRIGWRVKEVTTIEDDGFVEFCGLNFFPHEIRNPRYLKGVVQYLHSWPTDYQWNDRMRDFKSSLVYAPVACEQYSALLERVKHLCLTMEVDVPTVEAVDESHAVTEQEVRAPLE